MRIAVAAHSITDFYFTPHRHASLGTMAVSQAFSSIGAEVREFHFPLFSRRSRRIALPDSLAYLAPHILVEEYGPTAFFSAYRRLGPAPEECAKLIAAYNPEALLISSFAYAYADDAIALARAVRKLLPDIPVAAGGGGPSAAPGFFLAGKDIDYVVTGEVEQGADALYARLKEHTANSAAIPDRKDDGILTASAVHRKAELEPAGELLFPVRILPPRNGVRSVVLSSSRGCPKRCAFCSTYLTHGRQYRQVHIERIAQAIRDLPNDPGGGERYHFAFEDDNLLVDTARFLKILELIRQRFPTASFSAENGMDYLLLNRELVRELVLLGCTQFNLSVGSFTPEVLHQQHRSADLVHLREILETIDKLQVRSILYLIVGLRGDTPASAAAALLAVLGLPADIGISPYYALPGLPGFMESGMPLLSKGSSLFPWTGSLTTAELLTAFRLARLVQLMKHPDADRELLDNILKSRRMLTRIKDRVSNRKSIREVPGLSEKMLELFFSGLPRVLTPNRLK